MDLRNPGRSWRPTCSWCWAQTTPTAPPTACGWSPRHRTSCWRSPPAATRREDQVSKRALYRSLGVREYWQFDPTNDYLQPPLQGLELIEGEYRPLPARELADGTRAVLGLELRLTERGLRFHDPQTGEDLSNLGEIDAARQRAEQKRKKRSHAVAQEAAARRQEAAARQAAEARVAELEDLLRQTRGSDSGGDR